MLLTVILLSILASAQGMSMTRLTTGTYENSLPTSVIAKSYDLKLQPNMDGNYFNASVDINILCQETTDKIILHAHPELQIETGDVRLIYEGTQTVTSISITRNDADWIIIFGLESPLKMGESYHLYIEFKGIIHPKGRKYWSDGAKGGLFKVVDKKSSFLITKLTQNNSGRLFPCLDHLQFKAAFKISVARPRNMTALSVMPVESSESSEDESLVWDHFFRTPPISTTSLVLMVKELIKIEPINVTTKQGSYPLTFYHDKILELSTAETKLMLQIPKILEIIEQMLDVPFPLPKLDICLLPDHYADLIVQSTGGVITISNVISNIVINRMVSEILEQWMMHAVTYRSWDSYNVAKMITMFYMNRLQKIVKDDEYWMELRSPSLLNSHLRTMLRTPYIDGYSNYVQQRNPFWRMMTVWFLEMVESAISEQTFKKAMKNFFTDNMYKTIVEENLWDLITSQARQDKTLPPDMSVDVLATSWLKKRYAGFPLLTVTRNYEENTALLQQQLFVGNPTYSNQTNLTKEENGMMWYIPTPYISPSNLELRSTGSTAWMKEEKQSSISNLPDPNSFIIMNPTDSGMFLVNYDEHNWNLITDSMASANNKISEVTCRTVLQDAFLLAYAGILSYGTALNTSMCLYHSTNFDTWSSFLTLIYSPFISYEWTSVENGMNKYLRALIAQFLEKHQESSEVRSYKGINDFILEMAKEQLSTVGYQPYINRTHEKIISNVTTYPFEDPNSGLIIFCPEFMKDTSRTGDDDIKELEHYLAKARFYEKAFFQKSISRCPGYDHLVERVLNMTHNVKLDNFFWYTMGDVITNSEASLRRTIDFYLKNVNTTTFPLGMNTYSITAKIRSEELLNKLIDFQHEHENKTLPDDYKIFLMKAIPKAKHNVQWRKHNIPDLEKWIKEGLPVFEAINGI